MGGQLNRAILRIDDSISPPGVFVQEPFQDAHMWRYTRPALLAGDHG